MAIAVPLHLLQAAALVADPKSTYEQLRIVQLQYGRITATDSRIRVEITPFGAAAADDPAQVVPITAELIASIKDCAKKQDEVTITQHEGRTRLSYQEKKTGGAVQRDEPTYQGAVIAGLSSIRQETFPGSHVWFTIAVPTLERLAACLARGSFAKVAIGVPISIGCNEETGLWHGADPAEPCVAEPILAVGQEGNGHQLEAAIVGFDRQHVPAVHLTVLHKDSPSAVQRTLTDSRYPATPEVSACSTPATPLPSVTADLGQLTAVHPELAWIVANAIAELEVQHPERRGTASK